MLGQEVESNIRRDVNCSSMKVVVVQKVRRSHS